MKLIPVIEVLCGSKGIDLPENGPYWEYPDEWENYLLKSRKRAGFKDPLQSFEPGSFFCEAEFISCNNLKKIVIDHTADLRNGAYDEDEACALDGGYVLQINGVKLCYPQCCGDLSDIQFWRAISKGKEGYYNGHPQPIIQIENDEIIFDLNVQEFDEEFTPIPHQRTFRFERIELEKALEETEIILENFAKRIQVININEKLKLKKIEELLIFGK